MAKYTPESPIREALQLDLAAVAEEMREEPAYAKDGHTARTVVREADLRVVLIAMRASGRMADHVANGTITIQVLSGKVSLKLADRVAEVSPGQMLVIASGVRHDVEAAVDSAFVLTFGWNDKK